MCLTKSSCRLNDAPQASHVYLPFVSDMKIVYDTAEFMPLDIILYISSTLIKFAGLHLLNSSIVFSMAFQPFLVMTNQLVSNGLFLQLLQLKILTSLIERKYMAYSESSVKRILESSYKYPNSGTLLVTS